MWWKGRYRRAGKYYKFIPGDSELRKQENPGAEPSPACVICGLRLDANGSGRAASHMSRLLDRSRFPSPEGFCRDLTSSRVARALKPDIYRERCSRWAESNNPREEEGLRTDPRSEGRRSTISCKTFTRRTFAAPPIRRRAQRVSGAPVLLLQDVKQKRATGKRSSRGQVGGSGVPQGYVPETGGGCLV